MVLLASKIPIFMAKDAAALRLMWRVVINVQLATRTMDAHVEKMLKCILKKNYQRTVGTPLSCSLDLEKSGALCYPKCEEGYSGFLLFTI